MAQDLVLNELLKKIWAVDEKLEAGEPISEEEKQFFNEHISTIQNYYATKSKYWQNKTPL